MSTRHVGDGQQAQRAASLGIAAIAALVLVGGAALLGIEACAASDTKATRDAPKPGVTNPQTDPQPKQPEPKPEPRPEPEPLPPPAT